MRALLLRVWLWLMMIPAYAFAVDDSIEGTGEVSSKFAFTISNSVRQWIVIGLSLAFLGLPVFIGLKSAYSQYQKQEQMGAARGTNWTSIVVHGIFGYLGTLFLAALIVGAMDYLLHGAIFEAIRNFFANLSLHQK